MAHFQELTPRPHSHPRFRAGMSLRLTLVLTLLALVMETVTAQAQDGRAILLKTLQVYQQFVSYSGSANVDTMMLDSTGKAIKHIGSSSVMKLVKPNKIYIFFQTPIGSRKIYSDGVNFSVYDATPNQYITIPGPTTMNGLLQTLLTRADVAAQLDPLYFLTQKKLPPTLTNIKVKSSAMYNGHPVYIVTGTTDPVPIVIKKGKSVTIIQTSYWTWWIDRSTSLLYKIETKTPNIIKPVSFGTGTARYTKDIRGTLLVRHTVSDLKPDANVSAEEFAFTQPKASTRKQTVADIIGNKGK